MPTKSLFWLAAAFAALSTLLLAVLVFNGFMDWVRLLPREEARAITPLLLASSGVTAALGAAWRHKKTRSDDES